VSGSDEPPPAGTGTLGAVQGFQAVVTTGIYCRTDCTARPNEANVRPVTSPAAAEAAGYRACLRCRPYRVEPALGDIGPELVCRAVQLVVDGALDEANEADLARRLGVSARHLRRLFVEHVGATPDQVARSRRAHFARRLLDDTDLTITEVAFAAGFGSLRQFNRTCVDVFRASPTELRARRRKADRLVADGGLPLRLPFLGPLDGEGALAYLQARAIPGVEVVDGTTYRRTVVVDGDPGVLELAVGPEVLLTAHLPHWEGLIHVVRRARRILGLDADLDGWTAALGDDPTIGPLLRKHPGLRPLGTWDPFEVSVRAVVGQQISVAGATTILGRLAERAGDEVPGLGPMGLHRTFPSAEQVAGADLDGLGLTTTRAATIRRLAEAVATGEVVLDRSRPLHELEGQLTALPGIGPWTAQYVALRLGEPDAWPVGDRALERAMPTGADPEAWRPFRAAAAVHLWNA
jgi:AraC family transcriptional regulator, regulatory protein of adaptative response / DNA-3-methyladenine glycosylase II